MEDRNMRKSFLLLILLVLFLPFSVHAEWYCTSSQKIRLQSLATNIGSRYDYVEENHQVTFTLTIYNVSKDLYLVDENGNEYHPTKDMDAFVLSGYSAGRTYTFQIYSTIENCTDEAVYAFYVVTPPYNLYYDNPLCKGLEHEKLCQKWTSLSLTEEEFKSEIEKLKKEKPTEEKPKPEEKEDFISAFFEWYAKNYYYILPVIIIAGLGIIIYHNKKDSFGF